MPESVFRDFGARLQRGPRLDDGDAGAEEERDKHQILMGGGGE